MIPTWVQYAIESPYTEQQSNALGWGLDRAAKSDPRHPAWDPEASGDTLRFAAIALKQYPRFPPNNRARMEQLMGKVAALDHAASQALAGCGCCAMAGSAPGACHGCGSVGSYSLGQGMMDYSGEGGEAVPTDWWNAPMPGDTRDGSGTPQTTPTDPWGGQTPENTPGSTESEGGLTNARTGMPSNVSETSNPNFDWAGLAKGILALGNVGVGIYNAIRTGDLREKQLAFQQYQAAMAQYNTDAAYRAQAAQQAAALRQYYAQQGILPGSTGLLPQLGTVGGVSVGTLLLIGLGVYFLTQKSSKSEPPPLPSRTGYEAGY